MSSSCPPCSPLSSSSASATSLATQAFSSRCYSSSSPMSSSCPPCSPSAPLPLTERSRQEGSTSCYHAPWVQNSEALLVFFSILPTSSVVRSMSPPVLRG